MKDPKTQNPVLLGCLNSRFNYRRDSKNGIKILNDKWYFSYRTWSLALFIFCALFYGLHSDTDYSQFLNELRTENIISSRNSPQNSPQNSSQNGDKPKILIRPTPSISIPLSSEFKSQLISTSNLTTKSPLTQLTPLTPMTPLTRVTHGNIGRCM